MVLQYITSCKKIFNWNLSFDWTDYDNVKIVYTLWNNTDKITIPLLLEREDNTNDTKELMQEFVYSCYVRYEYDWQSLTMEEIWYVLWLSRITVIRIFEWIKKKVAKKIHLFWNDYLD